MNSLYNQTMLVRIKDLVNIADEKFYDIDIDSIVVENNAYLRRLEKNKGTISFFYDYMDKLCISYDLKGKMICPDSLTLEDVSVDYNLSNEEELAFKEDEEGFLISKDIELEKLVYQIVFPEVPIIVENCNKTGYYSGDGWSFMSEEEYGKAQKDKLDPRLQVLKDYKEEK